MISIKILIGILLVHWFADFVLQTDAQAKGKSKNIGMLLAHTATYALCWFVPAWLVFEDLATVMMFMSITWLAHTIQDYATSKLNSHLYAKGDTHNFFVSIGFDQVMHYCQLIFTYILLS